MEKELKKLREVEGRVNDRMDKGNDDVYADVKSHIWVLYAFLLILYLIQVVICRGMYRWLKQNRTRVAPDNAV